MTDQNPTTHSTVIKGMRAIGDTSLLYTQFPSSPIPLKPVPNRALETEVFLSEIRLPQFKLTSNVLANQLDQLNKLVSCIRSASCLTVSLLSMADMLTSMRRLNVKPLTSGCETWVVARRENC